MNIPQFFVEAPLDLTNFIIRDTFYTSTNTQQQIQLTLYKTGITLQSKDLIKWFPFDFQAKFTLLREKTEPPLKEKLPTPYGLKLERSPTQGDLILLNKQQSILIQWRNQLAKLINQRGFHDLYKPYRRIGRGNSATVYLAQRIQDKVKIAIKAFAKQSIASEAKGRESLINQIQIMRQLNHPTLMKLYEVFQTDNSYYLAIQHLEGGQLFEKVNNRRFNLKQIQQIIRKLTEGLIEMHKHSIIHRDLKPQNLIFRTPNDFNDIVIADYGLATKADQPEYIFIRCGTPGYVAPEIINFKGKTGQQTISDIFSLGIITHILATGRSPFTGRQYQQVLNQNRIATFNFELQVYKHIDPLLFDLMEKMMKVNPKERIKTQQILQHQFFNLQKIQDIIPNQDLSHTTLPHEQNNRKGMQRIIDETGSFTIAKPQIIKGNNEQYDSVNSMESNNSVLSSPQSIKLSLNVTNKEKRAAANTSQSQFVPNNRKTKREPGIRNFLTSRLKKQQTKQSSSKQQQKQMNSEPVQ